MDRLKKAVAPPASASAAPPADNEDLRNKLHAAMIETGMQFSADALAQSSVAMVANELVITTAKSFQLDLGRDEIQGALKHLGLNLKFKVVFGDVKASAPIAPSAPKEDEVTERALNHPDVQRFREVFGGEVRNVKNLREPGDD